MSEDEHEEQTKEEVEQSTTPSDFLDHEPSKQEKLEMRRANKRPSEWLKSLCRDWATENIELVESADAKFMAYKPYLKGLITSQLLCRLSLPAAKDDGNASNPVDFWSMLGIEDEFDKAYIVAQMERFCGLYSIRSISLDDTDGMFSGDISSPDAAAAGISVSPNGGIVLPDYMDQTAAAAAAAAAAAVSASELQSKLTKKQVSEVSKAHRMAKDAEKALENERRQNMKREQRRLSHERKEHKSREREAVSIRKAAERIARDSTREDRRRRKLEMRMHREQFAQEQKDLALKRAAELVSSNRVPIEITRGAAAAKAAANAALAAGGAPPPPVADEDALNRKLRSAIVVSTAADLHQIVTHSKNLWAKYNAIAKEHNQKVNWITVAKELGIHVKVREKYARMHSRAEQRLFDWVKNGHWKIKDHPDIFMEPTQAEQKAKMPPPPHTSTTVLIEDNKEVAMDDADVAAAADDAAVAAAAAVVDAAGVSVHIKTDTEHVVDTVIPSTQEQTAAAAAVAATFVADPTGA